MTSGKYLENTKRKKYFFNELKFNVSLAKEVEEIDLILGGHDHVSEFIQVTK